MRVCCVDLLTNAFGILARESLHVSTVCISRCENKFFVYAFMRHAHIFIHSVTDLFIDSAVIKEVWLPTSTASLRVLAHRAHHTFNLAVDVTIDWLTYVQLCALLLL